MSEVTITGGSPLGPDAIRRIVMDEAEQAMRTSVVRTEQVWKLGAQDAKRTGTYLRSITHSVHRVGLMIFGKIGTNLHYAPYLEYGTGIYGPKGQVIRPKRARALRFPDPGQGVGRNSPFRLSGQRRSGKAGAGARYVYARSVKGMRARHFARDAATASRTFVLNEFRQAGRRAAMRIARGA